MAEYIGADCTPAYLYWTLSHVLRSPQDWDLPRRWVGRPNWDLATMGCEVSMVLWRQPAHPARIPSRWRGLPTRMLAALLWDGHSPSTLWRGAPSKKTASEWLDAVAANRRYHASDWRQWESNPLTWVVRHCPIGNFVPRCLEVAEWLVAKKGWAGWHRPLVTGYTPDGVRREVKPQDLLDEIWPADLANGAKTSPERVFRAVMERTAASRLEDIARANAPLPRMPWTEIPGVEQILSGADLVAEGNRMNHCVGGYAYAAYEGQCYILRLPSSTVEIGPAGHVVQHQAYKNSAPCADDVKLLNKWLTLRRAR